MREKRSISRKKKGNENKNKDMKVGWKGVEEKTWQNLIEIASILLFSSLHVYTIPYPPFYPPKTFNLPEKWDEPSPDKRVGSLDVKEQGG